MSDKKSITIASDSLLGGSSVKRKSNRRAIGSGERKIRPSSIVQPSTLKKTLLERIKQHQRTRERSRRDDLNAADDASASTSASASASASDSAKASADTNDNFTQSIDFLRKLAMKRRQQQQHTQRRVHSVAAASSSSSSIGRFPEAKTPEAKMLNQVAETLHHGEILTNTGLLGLPVVPTIVSSSVAATAPLSAPINPMISLGPMPSFQPELQSVASSVNTPNITQLADMYNNTIASAEAAGATDAAAAAATATATGSETNEPPLHIPTKPEDYLPSIFIKEAPPHGCLKNGKKPTFREWATNMLKKPVDTIKDMFGGGDGASSGNNDSQQGGGGGGNGVSNGTGTGVSGTANADLNPDQVAGMRVKIRKTHKKRFRIGKHDDVVGVLLKNKQTQRHIQTQHLALRQKTIGEIRKYLYEHHLLKVGSNAPPDVLRRMYEDSILTGEVKNTNNDVLLHNFMSGGGGE
jgi:hypothetical protein